MADSPRWCDNCGYGNHHTDRCPNVAAPTALISPGRCKSRHELQPGVSKRCQLWDGHVSPDEHQWTEALTRSDGLPEQHRWTDNGDHTVLHILRENDADDIDRVAEALGSHMFAREVIIAYAQRWLTYATDDEQLVAAHSFFAGIAETVTEQENSP